MHLHPLNTDKYILISNKLLTVLSLMQEYLEIKIQEKKNKNN